MSASRWLSSSWPLPGWGWEQCDYWLALSAAWWLSPSWPDWLRARAAWLLTGCVNWVPPGPRLAESESSVAADLLCQPPGDSLTLAQNGHINEKSFKSFYIFQCFQHVCWIIEVIFTCIGSRGLCAPTAIFQLCIEDMLYQKLSISGPFLQDQSTKLIYSIQITLQFCAKFF